MKPQGGSLVTSAVERVMAREYPDTVSMRMTPLEKAALYSAAQTEGKAVAEYLRSIVMPSLVARFTGERTRTAA